MASPGPQEVRPAGVERRWWERPGLRYRHGSLRFAGHEVEALARELGTPLFLYDPARVGEKLASLHGALDRRGVAHRVFYAMKANRFAPLLTHLAGLGRCGIDACSPGEVRLARRTGFAAEEISYTATSVSERDLERLLGHRGLWINCDSLSSLERLGRRAPGREVGLRLDPALGIGYRENEKLRYSERPRSKMGIALEDLDRALAVAARHDLRVTGLHLHCGCGYLDPQIETFDRILERAGAVLDDLPGVRRMNVGGGLGVPLVADDRPLDLDAWSEVVASRLGGRGIEVWVEPGDYLVKDAGILACEVTTVERKRGVRYVGVDAGFNVLILPAVYGLPLQPVLCRPGAGPESAATVAGNINEAFDLFAVDVPLGEVEEGSFLCFLNAGGYGASMSSDHCLRGDLTEALVWR